MKRNLTVAVGLLLLAGPAGQFAQATTDPDPFHPTIVWTDSGTGKIQKLALTTGAVVQDVATGQITPKGITYNPALGRVYATNPVSPPPEQTLPRIRSYQLDGTALGSFDAVGANPTDIVSHTDPDPYHPGVFYDRWLWTDSSTGKLYYNVYVRGAEVNPLPPIPIIETGLVNPAGLALDDAHDGLFITDPGSGKLLWANQDGTGLTDLLTGLGDPRDVVGYTDPDPWHPTPFVVFTDAALGKVCRADLAYNSAPTVTNVTDLITSGIVEPTGVALDLEHGWMFITDPGSGTIWRSNLDGSGLTALVTGLSDPWGITFIAPEPASLALLAVGALAALRRRRGIVPE